MIALHLCLVSAFGQERFQARKAAIIPFEGMIHPIRQQYFYRKLDTAQSQEIDLVIIEINSPGGFLETSLELARRLRDLDWTKTVAYVREEALSGAAIMALGCDEIVMEPEALLGDAGPVFQGEDALFRHAPEKIRSNLERQVRDLAERTGRPPALAAAMVDMDLVVYRVKNRKTGEETYMSDSDIESSDDADQWDKGPPVQESRKGLFLEVNGRRAEELGLADATVSSLEELAARYGLQEDELVVLQTTWVDTTILVLNSLPVTILLLIVGSIAIYVELSAPGISIGGLIAGLCFTLFFWSRFLGGTSGWLEVVLFLLGIAFLAIELFVMPGFGFAGIAGMFLLAISVVLASQHFTVPQSGLELRTFLQSILVVAGSGVGTVVAAVVISKYLGTIPILGRLALEPPSPQASANVASESDGAAAGWAEALGVKVGDVGVADSPLRPAGRARFSDEYVDVVADGSFVDKGRSIRIIRLSGNRITVREVT